jgi:hypothetical protein
VLVLFPVPKRIPRGKTLCNIIIICILLYYIILYIGSRYNGNILYECVHALPSLVCELLTSSETLLRQTTII